MKNAAVLLWTALLLISACGCVGERNYFGDKKYENNAAESKRHTPKDIIEATSDSAISDPEEEKTMRIRIQANEYTIVYELNDSQAAKDFYDQLPLTAEVENFSTNEKVFYPPEDLDTVDAPLAEGGKGILAYYKPWGDVVMFYAHFGKNSSLFELGKAVSGEDDIGKLSGTVEITTAE